MLHITSIKPMFTSILTTGDKFENDETDGGVIVAKQGELKLYQTVLAVGSAVRDINVGDKVMIDPSHFAVKKYNKDSVQNDLDNNPVLSYNFPFETVEDEDGNSKDCLFITSNDIKFVFEGYEKEDNVQINTGKIILPGKSKLIL